MVQNIIDGNYFGGQLLVKINREVTSSPKPIGKTTILFDGGDSEAKSQKAELFRDLAKAKQKKGQEMANYDKQPPIKKKQLELWLEIYYICNISNDGKGDYKLVFTIGEKVLQTLKPNKSDNNELEFLSSSLFQYEFDFVQMVDTTGTIDDNVEKNTWI